jgi:predicted HAD superfamily phosphohydrolase YqeG
MTITAAFDVDGTLIKVSDDSPRYDVIQLFHLFEKFGCTMVIWSGSGRDYCERWAEKLGLNGQVMDKKERGTFVPDIAIDDEEVTLGKVNFKV